MVAGYSLGTAYGKIVIDGSGVQSGITQAQNSLTAGLNRMGQSVSAFGGQLSSIGTGISALTAPFTALGILSAKTAIEFESAFAGVKKTVNATDEEFAILEQRIIDMATSPDQLTSSLENADVALARIMELAGQLGVSGVDNLSKFTETIALLQVSTDLLGDDAALSLAQFANITQMPIENIDRLGSVIVALGNNMATTETSIVEMAQRLAGAGNVVGLTQDQIMALSAALSSVGINAEAGGSAFSRVMLDINAAVDGGGEKLDAFAAVAKTSAAEFARQWEENPVIALNRFIAGLRDANNEGQNMTAILEDLDLNDIRVRDSLLRLATGSDVLTEALEISGAAWEENSALMTEAGRRAETTESGLNRLQNNLRELRRTIGEQITPAINQLSERLIPIIQRITDWVKANPELIQQIIKIVAALSVVGPTLLIAGKGIQTVGGLISSFSFLLNLLISPLGIVIALFAGLGFLAAGGDLGAFIERLQKGLGGIIGSLTNFQNNVQQFGLGTAIASVIANIGQALGLVEWDTIPDSIQNFANAIVGLFISVQQIYETQIKPVIDDFIALIVSIWDVIGPPLMAVAAWFITDGLPLVVNFISGVVMPVIQTFIDILSMIWTLVSPALTELFDWFVNTGLPWITQKANEFVDTLGNIVQSIRDWIADHPGFVVAAAGIGLALVGLQAVAFIASGAFSILRGAVGLLQGAFFLLTSPAILVAAAIAAILYAVEELYPGGIAQALRDAATAAQQLAFLGLYVLAGASEAARQLIILFINTITDTIAKVKEWIETNPGLTLAIVALGIALVNSGSLMIWWKGILIIAGLAVQAAGFIWGLFTGVLGVLSGGFTIAGISIGGFTTAMWAAIGPILAVGIAIAGVILQIKEFLRITGEAGDYARTEVGKNLASGNITNQDIYDKSFGAIASQFGGGILGDVMARLFYTNVAQTAGARDSGGFGVADTPYLIGRGAQPEVFIPQSNGQFIPNFDEVLAGAAGGGDTYHITIYANDAAGGAAAADMFEDRLRERRRQRGNG